MQYKLFWCFPMIVGEARNLTSPRNVDWSGETYNDQEFQISPANLHILILTMLLFSTSVEFYSLNLGCS